MTKKRPFFITALLICVSVISLQCVCTPANAAGVQSGQSMKMDCHASEGRHHSASDESKDCCSKCVSENTAVLQKITPLKDSEDNQSYYPEIHFVIPEKAFVLAFSYFSDEIMRFSIDRQGPIAYHLAPRSPPVV